MSNYAQMEDTLWRRYNDSNAVPLAIPLDGCWWSLIRDENASYGLVATHGHAQIGSVKTVVPSMHFGLQAIRPLEKGAPVNAQSLMRQVTIIYAGRMGDPIVVVFRAPSYRSAFGLHFELDAIPGVKKLPTTYAITYDDPALFFSIADQRSKGIYLIRDIHNFLVHGKLPEPI